MKPKIHWLLTIALCLCASTARAESFTHQYSTTGFFTCGGPLPCSASGGTSIRLGTDTDNVVFSFEGLTNRSIFLPAGVTAIGSAGTLRTIITGQGFTFPPLIGSATGLPLLFLNISIDQLSPTVGGGTRGGFFAGSATPTQRGGSIGFGIQGTSNSIYLQGPMPGYITVYQLRGTLPFTFTPDGEQIPLEVSNIPEPATMILLGTGLAGIGALRRRFRR